MKGENKKMGSKDRKITVKDDKRGEVNVCVCDLS